MAIHVRVWCTTYGRFANAIMSSARDIVRHVGEPNSERRQANIRSRSAKLGNRDGMATGKADEGFIAGYWSTIVDKESKRRYADKLRLVDGSDPYEVATEDKDWNDNIDMLTRDHVCSCVPACI